MPIASRTLKRAYMSPHRVYVGEGTERQCGCFFLDSGAHTIYTLKEIHTKHRDNYKWYRSLAFRKYLDAYAAFLKANKEGIDYYANVDAIFEPDISWKALKYLEQEHGLNPVPVIHYNTPMRWVDKHLEAGYDFLGIGGLGQEAPKRAYIPWADTLYDHLCDNKDRLPCVRTHGFAMTSYDLMIRWPWWSVDSASWAKAAGFGSILVPHKRNGEFTFAVAPYVIAFSHRSGAAKEKGRHYMTVGRAEQKVVLEWLEKIGVPLGSVNPDGSPKEYGVYSQYNARALACLRFYDQLCKWLPEWPWSFRKRPAAGGFFNKW
jgi:hypothetical protein